jgi:hypothetical protein
MRPAHASKFSTSELAELLEPIRVYGEEDNQLHPEHINLVTMVAVPRFLKQVVARVHQVPERESPHAIASDIAMICQITLILVLLGRPSQKLSNGSRSVHWFQGGAEWRHWQEDGIRLRLPTADPHVKSARFRAQFGNVRAILHDSGIVGKSLSRAFQRA